MKQPDAIELLLDSNRGVYIPQHFVEEFNTSEFAGIDQEDIDTCLAGPDQEEYWEAWELILNNAVLQVGENCWHLHHDGDLWLICPELMTAEERENFGFEEA